jgi:phospholipid transport system transporter-binding protein
MAMPEMLSLPAQLNHGVDIPRELGRLWALSPAEGAVEVDASTLEKLDSSAVALLLEWQRRLQRRRQALVIRNPSAALTSLLQVYGVGELLAISSL